MLPTNRVRLLQIAASRYPEQLGCPARLTELMSSVIVIAESDPQSFRKLYCVPVKSLVHGLIVAAPELASLTKRYCIAMLPLSLSTL